MLRRLLATALCFLAGLEITPAQAETGTLTVRVKDAASGKPLAARLALQASDGSYPGDRIGLSQDRWPNLEARGVFISGEGTFELPPGKTNVLASRGPQYIPERREVEVIAGRNITAEISLKRDIDLRKAGWVCGDAHLHMIHGEMQRETSYEEVATTCAANGLDWAYVNQEYVGAGQLDVAGYHEQCRQVSDASFQLLLGGERPKSLLGHNALIGVTNPFVIPDDPPYHAAARVIHEQGGVLFPVHPVRYFPDKQWMGNWLDFPGNNLARELVFDAHLGPSFDGLSVLSDEPAHRNAHALWFNLLNQGWFVPALADSDACFDRPVLGRGVPGFWATYVYVGPDGKVDGPSLAEAVRRGRTMATTGPLVVFRIDGELSGATVATDGQPHEITIEAHHAHHNWTLAEARLAKVELIRNGELVRVWEPNLPEVKLSLTVTEREPCWYAVRVLGTDERWQVALASPIYFAPSPVQRKQQPLTVHVRGRVYDFADGKPRKGTIQIFRHGKLLKEFAADGQFAVNMPLDATISAHAPGVEPVSHDLLLGYGPVHGFLWKLRSDDLARPETFAQFRALVEQVDLEFPLGYRMPGCYAVQTLEDDLEFQSVRISTGPSAAEGSIAVATVLLDKRQAKPGDVINVAAIYRDERPAGQEGDLLLVAEGRAYDPQRPTGFNPLKVFATFESAWSKATEVAPGYRMIVGKLKVPDWVGPGPVGALEINVFSRGGGKTGSQLGMRMPLGETSRALMAVSNWPTVPLSWHDHNYGIGPLQVCGKNGRTGQPRGDYRQLRMAVKTTAGEHEIFPARDARGCPDADDAVFTGHFFDQILNDESQLAPAETIRPQPRIQWRDVSVVDATGGK